MHKVIALDIGNTRMKLGVFENRQLSEIHRVPLGEIDSFLSNFDQSNVKDVVISSVVSEEQLAMIKQFWKNPIIIDHRSKLPFENIYKTPETLGIDRICNATYAYIHSSTDCAVVIDLGTCIKFDIVDKEKGYLGGSISPGIQLRYKALNEFTGNLPLLNNTSSLPVIGNSTRTSMQSGVINGIRLEIEGFITDYANNFPDLTFFVTGGDLEHFDLASKNDIFADENLTLKGLYEIYRYNA